MPKPKRRKRETVIRPQLGAPRQLRLSDDLTVRILAYQKELRDKYGIETNFSSTVRTLIEQGLKASR